MPIIGRDRFHHGRLPVALGRSPASHGTKGGLEYGASEGPYRRAIEGALRMIAAARLPDGSRPVLSGEVDFVKNASAVKTSVLYGLLPLGNSTKPNYDDRGVLTHIDIKITSLDFIGTKAKQPRHAHAGHPAEGGHPAIPAMYEDGSPRVFEATLAHELGHAARILRHQTFPDFLVEERLVSNLENQYRYARGIAQRKFYGDTALKQYPQGSSP